MKKYFIIVDMQIDFLTGSLANKDAVAIIPNIVNTVKAKKEQGYTIIATRDTHYNYDYLDSQEGKNLPIKHCIVDTEGWEVVKELTPFIDKYVDKDSFGYESWNDELSNHTEEIEMCGTCTDICVVSNALILKAEFPEVPITVYKDLCAGLTKEKHEAALETMRSCQINVL